MDPTKLRRLSAVIVALGITAIAAGSHAMRAHASDTMAGMSMGAAGMKHMTMTTLRSEQPGDRVRADAIVRAARAVMTRYPDVAAAEAAGFEKFLPGLSLPEEHFTNYTYAREALHGTFDPLHPTSLIFHRQGSSLKLVGVMYTAARGAAESTLDAEVPLSIAQWHRHVDFCFSPGAGVRDPRFGMLGSIDTQAECTAAGGRWKPQIFGWMVHVWPLEHDPARIWAVHLDDA